MARRSHSRIRKCRHIKANNYLLNPIRYDAVVWAQVDAVIARFIAYHDSRHAPNVLWASRRVVPVEEYTEH